MKTKISTILTTSILLLCTNKDIDKNIVLQNKSEFENIISLLETTDNFDRFGLNNKGEVVSKTIPYICIDSFFIKENIDEKYRIIPQFMIKHKILEINKENSSDYYFVTGGFVPSGDWGFLYTKNVNPKKKLKKIAENWYINFEN